MDEDKLAQTVAKSEAWLASNPLNRWTVLDYFALTHFYEPTGCLNELALAAGRHRSETAELSCDKRQHEYVVSEALEPTLYVIQKRTRLGVQGTPVRLAVFFCLHGCVYAAPSLQAVLATRLSRCTFDLRAALEALREGLAPPKEEAQDSGCGPAGGQQETASVAQECARRVEAFAVLALQAWDSGQLACVAASDTADVVTADAHVS